MVFADYSISKPYTLSPFVSSYQVSPMTNADPTSPVSVALEQIAQLHRLDAATWKYLIGQAQQRDCEAGEVLFDEGDFNPNLFLLISGHVDLLMKVTGRGWVKILTLAPGDIIAWSAVLSAGRMTCRATCTTGCRLIYWRQELLDAVCRSQPEFAYEWMRFIATALSQRLLATRLQLLDLFSADSRSRPE